MSVKPAPITQNVIDENGFPTLPWTLFFNQSYQGDAGDTWDANFIDLTGNTASAVGRYYRISQYLVFFSIIVVPNGNTSSVAGTTYIDNFPLTFNGNGFNTVLAGLGGGAIGINRSSDNRIYIPAWTNLSDPLTIIGFGEAS